MNKYDVTYRPDPFNLPNLRRVNGINGFTLVIDTLAEYTMLEPIQMVSSAASGQPFSADERMFNVGNASGLIGLTAWDRTTATRGVAGGSGVINNVGFSYDLIRNKIYALGGGSGSTSIIQRWSNDSLPVFESEQSLAGIFDSPDSALQIVWSSFFDKIFITGNPTSVSSIEVSRHAPFTMLNEAVGIIVPTPGT